MKHSLRPDFTYALARRLSSGASINLISPHGQGRRRTLADLRRQLPASMQTLQLNMRDCKHDYDLFFAILGKQTSEQTPYQGTFDTLLDTIATQDSPTLLILHNFDELRAFGCAAAYGADFFRTLNRIAEIVGLALLCVCESKQTHYRLQCDGSPLSGSSLNADNMLLPPLDTILLQAELRRRYPSLSTRQRSAIAAELVDHDAPYRALQSNAILLALDVT